MTSRSANLVHRMRADAALGGGDIASAANLIIADVALSSLSARDKHRGGIRSANAMGRGG